jgi:hypothetical protein
VLAHQPQALALARRQARERFSYGWRFSHCRAD